MDQFVDSLPDEDMRLRIRQSRPESLRKALEASLELESYQLASKQRSRVVREVNLESLEDSKHPGEPENEGDLLQQLIALLKRCFRTGNAGRYKKSPRRRGQGLLDSSLGATCWNCREKGHLKRNCPKKPGDRSMQPSDVSPSANGQ